MVNRYMKRCSILLVVREIQIKTTRGYHFIPVRMAIIKKSIEYKLWRGCGEKGTLLHCWLECKLVQLLWKTVWSFLKKLNIELPYDPETSLTGIYPKKKKILIEKDTLTPTCSQQHYLPIAEIWKQTKCPSAGEWIKKLCLHIYIYSSLRLRRNQVLLSAAIWMGLENTKLSKISQRKTNAVRYHLWIESKKII